MSLRTRFYSVAIAFFAAIALAGCSHSDAGITTAVKAKMIADPAVDADGIHVSTKDGVVTLEGNIDSEKAKDRALHLAGDTKGVVRVTDMVEVRRPSGGGDAPDPGRTVGATIDDAGITLRVKDRLADDPLVHAGRIDVDTRNGVVFLTGNVDTRKERDRAIELASKTEGVRDVQPNLRIGKG